MTKRLISFLIALCIFIAIPLSARYKYNPFTRKLDYYETGADIDLGDLADVTLTGAATGNVLYYNGTAWVNLATGANTNVLTLAAGIPSWAAPGAPAAHAPTHLAAGADPVDHDQLLNYVAGEHLLLPNTIVAVLNDHNLAAHTALGLFDASADVDHNLTTNYFIYNHVGEDHLVDHNIWIGWLAGEDLAVGGQYNTLVGEQAGTDITTGDNNTIVGFQAGFTRTSTSGSTFVGYQAGHQNLGDLNTAVGYQALYNAGAQNEDTIKNVAIGAGALYSVGGEAAQNVAVGFEAQYNLTGENEYNIAIGSEAGYSATGANYNVLVGAMAGKFNLAGTRNTVIGHQAGQGVATNSYSDNVLIGSCSGYSITVGQYNTFVGNYTGNDLTDGLRNTVIGEQAAEELSTGDDNIVIGYRAGEGWLDTENEKLVIDVTDTTTPLIYGDFAADNISINGDFSVLMDAALDQVLIQQSAVAGTEDQPLIYIDDDRTGVTVDEIGEATLVIESAGTYSTYFKDGNVFFAVAAVLDSLGDITTTGKLWAKDNAWITWGTATDWQSNWDNNAAGDDLLTFVMQSAGAGNTTAIWWSQLNPSGMTDHNGYTSPTFVLTNSEGADANDYSGVVIGERAQADVTVAHYFDFYAMTGAADGSVEPGATEIAAIFRFGPNGTGVPTYATTPGDMLFEGSTEVDGNTHVAGYRRADTVYWVDCFDHGTVANKYQWDWDITSLSTQGTGTNTVDTTPSEITLTTDNNAVGDNEGTRTEFAIIQRARQNRSEFEIELGQTANTQFYCGWNTSGTNVMVADANEYVIVFFDESDNANWQIKVGDGTTEDVFTSGVAGAVSHIIHEIWVETNGTVHWRVNGTELDITGSVDNLMTANDHYLIVGQAQSVTGAAAIVVEIDYVENEKNKTH